MFVSSNAHCHIRICLNNLKNLLLSAKLVLTDHRLSLVRAISGKQHIQCDDVEGYFILRLYAGIFVMY